MDIPGPQKRGTGAPIARGGIHFVPWTVATRQARYYNFNVRNYDQHLEELRHIHRNPLRRGLCEQSEDWEWSSFRQHATGYEGRVGI